MGEWREIKGLEDYLINEETFEIKNKEKNFVLSEHTNRYVYVSIYGKPEPKHRVIARAFPEICGEWFVGAEVHHKDFNPFNNHPSNLLVLSKAEHQKIHSESEITRSKHSQYQKGRKMSEEARENMRKAQLGRKATETTKKKMSESHKQRYIDNPDLKNRSEEYKKKISKTLTGKYVGFDSIKGKIVEQYSLDLELLNTYGSIQDASRQNGWNDTIRRSICACCNGKQKTAYGFIWKYKESA